MSHIRKFEGFKKSKTEEKINEDTNIVEYDGSVIYKVNVVCDVPAKLLSSYAKKVKQNTKIEMADQYSNKTSAEELVKYVLKDGLDADKIPATALVGGSQTQGQTQAQGQGNMSANAQGQLQDNGSQVQVQSVQAQPQSQAQGKNQEDFESVQNDEDLPM